MTNRPYVFFFSCLFAACPLDVSRAQGNVVINGDFENGADTLQSWRAGATPGFPIYYAADPGIQTNGAGVNHFALISGNAIFPLEQDIATIPGAYYCLSLSLISFSGTNSCDISAGTLSTSLQFQPAAFQINNWTTANTNWQDFSVIFQAISTNTAVSIFYHAQVLTLPTPPPMTQYYGEGGLDSVSVTLVPEPTTTTLLAAGALVVLAGKRRRH